MKNRPTLSATDRSDESVTIILRGLLHALTSNIDGVLEDTDNEFLHDLRVAGRRTRTALSQLKGVLPDPAVEVFAPEFKWLGVVTGPRRDLDVMLLEINSIRCRTESDDRNFNSLISFLDNARRAEHSKVCAALRGTRFLGMIEDWGNFLESPAQPGTDRPLASLPIDRVAGPRILEAHRRIVKRHAKLPYTQPADHMHSLRIDAKKLRYLLEFFSSIFPQDATAPLITELKKIQNILGEFNDTVVQQRLLVEVGGHPMAAIGSRGEPVTTIDWLGGLLAQRQNDLRNAFSEQFESFVAVEIQNAGFNR